MLATLLLHAPGPLPTARVRAQPFCRSIDGHGYVRGSDGGEPVDARLVNELIAKRSSLRAERNFRAADEALAEINRLGVTLWDRERVWMVGTAPPPRVGSAPSGRAAAASAVGRGKATRIFVTNLAYEAEWQQLRDHFAAGGHRAVFTRINTDRRTGEPRGSGVVQFDSAAEASAALDEMDGSTLMGRRLSCRPDLQWSEHGRGESDEMFGATPEPPDKLAWQSKAWSRAAGTLDDAPEAAAVDPAEVISVLQRRDAAREARDFGTADRLLDELAALGISVDDARRQKRWWLGKRAEVPQRRPAVAARGDVAPPRGAADARRRAWFNEPPLP